MGSIKASADSIKDLTDSIKDLTAEDSGDSKVPKKNFTEDFNYFFLFHLFCIILPPLLV